MVDMHQYTVGRLIFEEKIFEDFEDFYRTSKIFILEILSLANYR